MAKRQSDGPAKTDIDMTPMIDVTFQLITFFIFTLNFSNAVQDDRVQLPLSQLAKPAESPADDPITLQLWPDKDGMTKVIYNGEAEASRVPTEWFGWLHKTWNATPLERQAARKFWEKPSLPNLTGTAYAYAPPGSIRRPDPPDRQDYEAWTPE